ncbi:MAG TPA: hypothetical protein EYQ24_10045 [Bacteroidetes bacterium]|nr:hypothetical protein [Bacteroidota bacterium]HIL57450.1 hypothetical protein [Rhodothermales bacterium]
MTTPLTSAFEAERDALLAVATSARAQVDALAEGPDAFEAAVSATLDAVSDLDACQRRRQRHAADPTSGDVDPAAREALESAAADAQHACDVLAFALRHAAALGRDLLRVGHESEPLGQVYTARGAVAATGRAVRPLGTRLP